MGSGFACGNLAGAAALALLSRQADSIAFGPAVRRGSGAEHAVDVSQPTVVNKIQQLQAARDGGLHGGQVVSGEKENVILPDFLAGDRLLMLVHGEVVAGVDFSGLNTAMYRSTDGRCGASAIRARCSRTRIDSARTRVYSRHRAAGAGGSESREHEDRAATSAAAVVDGILKTAQQNARTTLTSLLQGLGFGSVEFY